LFLLVGFLNPAQVLRASVFDFDKPWFDFIRTFFQGLSILFLIPMLIKIMAPASVKRMIALGIAFLSINSLVCYFILFTSYGIMDRNFRFDDTNRLLYAFPLWVNIIAPIMAVVIIFIFLKFNKEKILAAFFKLTCAAVLILGIINLVIMQTQIVKHGRIAAGDNANTENVFRLSRTRQNVFIISLDRAQGSAIADILEYKPELKNELDGFEFFPNTLSFGVSTIIGVPAMLGGYDYTPLEINKREDVPLIEKVNSAIRTIPKHFGEAGYRVTITDPVIANLNSVADTSIFRNMENVNAFLLSGKLSDRFRMEFPSVEETGVVSFNFDILFRYGLFRIAPPALRYGIYYKGQWWREAAFNSFGRAIGEFSTLYYLNDITVIDNEEPALNIFMNFITHEGGNYNYDFFPQQERVEFNSETMTHFESRENAEYIYLFISAIKQLIKWFDFLKSENVYDNTRIIIVSDHGGRYKANTGNEGFNPVLMVKDFNNRGLLRINETFMTHADTPYLAGDGLSGVMLNYSYAQEAKNSEIIVVTAVSAQPIRHGPMLFNLNGRRKIIGREVLNSESWGEWERY